MKKNSNTGISPVNAFNLEKFSSLLQSNYNQLISIGKFKSSQSIKRFNEKNYIKYYSS